MNGHLKIYRTHKDSFRYEDNLYLNTNEEIFNGYAKDFIVKVEDRFVYIQFYQYKRKNNYGGNDLSWQFTEDGE